MYRWKYHNLTSMTTLIKWQWTCVCLGKQSLSVDVTPLLNSTCLFSPVSLISLGCQVCPEEHYTMMRTTMNMMQGRSLLHLSPGSLHVNLLYPAARTAGPPPHSLENNCCLLMAAVLLLQKEAQTLLWEISARRILLRAFVFAYTDTDRGC